MTRQGSARAREILRALHPAQRQVVKDPSPHVAAVCPRRAGKSFAGAAAALATGEAKPGSISLIISLNLKQLRRIYWSGGPSGLFALDRKFGLNLKFHRADFSWTHENGSMGYLLGAEDPEQREVIRGLEADLYLVDECKSFAPAVLEELIDEIIDPGRATRRGRLILIGTPGPILDGPFYQATCPSAVDGQGRRYLVPAGEQDPHGRTPKDDFLWSFHAWTLQDNQSAPHQWEEALKKKRAKGWADDDPTWLHEYLGRWTPRHEGMVYRYHPMKSTGLVTWTPEQTVDNPTGLPAEGAPWHLVAGLDLGFEDATAMVVLGYSQRLRQVRHVWDASEPHLLMGDVAEMIASVQSRFGKLEMIFVDNQGKQLVESMIAEYGFPLVRADKRDKYDHIELVNAGFVEGEIKIVPGTKLEQQLIADQWDLGDRKLADVVRTGRLKEIDSIPNDVADAFLYAYRGAHHHFGRREDVAPQPGTLEYQREWEREQLARARREVSLEMKQRADVRRVDLVGSAPTYLLPALAGPRSPLRGDLRQRPRTWI